MRVCVCVCVFWSIFFRFHIFRSLFAIYYMNINNTLCILLPPPDRFVVRFVPIGARPMWGESKRKKEKQRTERNQKTTRKQPSSSFIYHLGPSSIYRSEKFWWFHSTLFFIIIFFFFFGSVLKHHSMTCVGDDPFHS